MEKVNLSVVLPFYSGDDHKALDLAIDSICNQVYKADEIVLVQDGPIGEELASTVSAWKKRDSKIVHVVISENQGLANALNTGIRSATGEWIARMDADDFSVPLRFKKQMNFLQSNPEVDLIGSNIIEYDEGLSVQLGVRSVPESHSQILNYAKWRCPFNHMTVIFRKSSIEDIGLYKNYSAVGDDYELWVRFLVNGYHVHNIQEPLVHARTGVDMLVNRRRGWKYLMNEIEFLRDIRKMGFFNWVQYNRNILIRTFLRLGPLPILRLAYGKSREKV